MSNGDNIEVSIILPAYNGEKWIERAIRSALSQSLTNFEFLIIDDGSEDGTETVVMKLAGTDPRIKYSKNKHNLGVQKTRNIALGMARGKYIAEIDQDDEWTDKHKLYRQVQFLKKNSEYVLVGTGAVILDEREREIARYLMPMTDIEIRKKILRMNCFIHSSVVYRADAVKKVGGYTVEKMSEDHDLWLRLGRVGKFTNFPEYLVRYRFSKHGYNSQNKIVRLRQNLLFVEEHKDFYPNHVRAAVMGWLKILFYPLFFVLSSKVKGVFLKLHKKM